MYKSYFPSNSGYFPLMASQPFGAAEVHENNRKSENNFYK